MKILLQRVSRAEVRVEARSVGRIGPGLLALIGLEPEDDLTTARAGIDRILRYRVFSDADDRMNLSLTDTGGGLLLVSQFTLAADTHKGNRPGFSTAMPPAAAEPLFQELIAYARTRHTEVAAGEFGAMMSVELVNDGPVTFLL